MSNSDVQVLWVSKVYLAPGMRVVPHVHDYFHFTCLLAGHAETADGSRVLPNSVTCNAPETVHGGTVYPEGNLALNVMFLVPDKAFYKEVEQFPYRKVPPERTHVPLLRDIAAQIETLSPEPDFINSAFSYYLHLLFRDNRDLIEKTPSLELAEKCKEYINGHFAETILLDDIAAHIGRSRNYTSTLFSEAYGMTLIEYANAVRIRHACNLISYSDTPTEEIIQQCGFNNIRNFNRVFMRIIGTTPARYRTTHRAEHHLQYPGNPENLKKYRSAENCFTYTVDAEKRVDWPSVYDYMAQVPPQAPDQEVL